MKPNWEKLAIFAVGYLLGEMMTTRKISKAIISTLTKETKEETKDEVK